MSSLIRQQEDPNTSVTALWFAADGWVPNNTRLPALCYRQVIELSAADRVRTIENLLGQNGWPPQWRNGIYPFHHYHSNAHEVLGIANGTARIRLGGPRGAALTLSAGDCVLLPAGTGHCLLEASSDLLVVGAYPAGQDWDLRRDALSSSEHAAMMALPTPKSDPIMGSEGALVTFWLSDAVAQKL